MSFHKKLEIREHAGAVYTCTFDGEFLYSGSADKYVTRWNVETGLQDKFAIKFNDSVYSIAIAGTFLFVGLSSGDLHIFDLTNKVEVKFYQQHKSAIFSTKLDSVNGFVYVGDADGNLSVWDTRLLELVIFLPLGCGKIRDIGVSDDGSTFYLACQDKSIRVFETKHFNEVQTLFEHKDAVTSVTEIAGCLISGGKDAHLKKWSLTDGTVVKDLPAHNFAIYRIMNIEDFVITASRDKTIKVWSSNLEILKRLNAKEGGHSHSVNDICQISKNSFASCGDDRRIIVWGISEPQD